MLKMCKTVYIEIPLKGVVDCFMPKINALFDCYKNNWESDL